MRGLTVRQPWVHAIAEGLKLVENRGRGAQHWNPAADVAIHAGLAWSYRGATDARVVEALGRGELRRDDPLFTRGAIVAIADIADVHPDAHCCRPWGESTYAHADGTYVQQVTHLVLENVRKLATPVLYRGQLGMWTVPDDVERAVRREVRAA